MAATEKPFEPLGSPVKIYFCGLTPKDYPHLGHAKPFVMADVMRRYLRYRGYDVLYVQNFTDVEDKLIARSSRGPGCARAGPARARLSRARPSWGVTRTISSRWRPTRSTRRRLKCRRKTRATSRSGRGPSPASPPGTAPGAQAGRVGTSSA